MIAIPLHTRRVQRGQFFQKLQHALPSGVVLGDGISHVQHDPHGLSLVLGAAEIAVSVLVIVTVVRGLRQLIAHRSNPHSAHPHRGVDWIDVSLGAMLSVEVYAKYYANGHIARPTILLAVTMFVIGFNHGRLAAWGSRKRELRVTDEGISARRLSRYAARRVQLARHSAMTGDVCLAQAQEARGVVVEDGGDEGESMHERFIHRSPLRRICATLMY